LIYKTYVRFYNWNQPIAEGKAAVSGIVAHLMQWDRYFITNTIPSVHSGNGIVFPDFDAFNASAYEYARSGVSKSELLEELCATRTELCQFLLEAGEETLRKPVAVNGIELCPHTGTPYTLLYIIQESIDHDRHHIGQIDGMLAYDWEAVRRLKAHFYNLIDQGRLQGCFLPWTISSSWGK
jgi:hypothetical protein